MSKVRSDNISNRADDGAPKLVYGAEVPVGYGITGAGGINITGVATATSFSGNLTGNVSGATGTFTGNVSIGGTLTYEDVTNVDSVGLITARSGVKVPDAQKIFLGTGDDLQIYHSGSHSFIVDSGVGSLYIRSSGGNIQDQGNANQSWLQFNSGAGVEAHFAGNKKFETTTSGVTVTGAVSDSIGPLRRLGVNAQGGAYAFVVGDAGKIIRSAGSGSALTLNQNIFTAGDMISVFNVGSGTNTVVQGTGVTLYNTADAATGTRTIAAKGMCTIVCTASNEFAISGSQLS